MPSVDLFGQSSLEITWSCSCGCSWKKEQWDMCHGHRCCGKEPYVVSCLVHHNNAYGSYESWSTIHQHAVSVVHQHTAWTVLDGASACSINGTLQRKQDSNALQRKLRDGATARMQHQQSPTARENAATTAQQQTATTIPWWCSGLWRCNCKEPVEAARRWQRELRNGALTVHWVRNDPPTRNIDGTPTHGINNVQRRVNTKHQRHTTTRHQHHTMDSPLHWVDERVVVASTREHMALWMTAEQRNKKTTRQRRRCWQQLINGSDTATGNGAGAVRNLIYSPFQDNIVSVLIGSDLVKTRLCKGDARLWKVQTWTETSSCVEFWENIFLHLWWLVDNSLSKVCIQNQVICQCRFRAELFSGQLVSRKIFFVVRNWFSRMLVIRVMSCVWRHQARGHKWFSPGWDRFSLCERVKSSPNDIVSVSFVFSEMTSSFWTNWRTGRPPPKCHEDAVGWSSARSADEDLTSALDVSQIPLKVLLTSYWVQPGAVGASNLRLPNYWVLQNSLHSSENTSYCVQRGQ